MRYHITIVAPWSNNDPLLPTHVEHTKQIKLRRTNSLPLAFDPNPYKPQTIPPRPEHSGTSRLGRWFNYTKENAAVIGLFLTFVGVIVAIAAMVK